MKNNKKKFSILDSLPEAKSHWEVRILKKKEIAHLAPKGIAGKIDFSRLDQVR